jgi:hypothetical protein
MIGKPETRKFQNRGEKCRLVKKIKKNRVIFGSVTILPEKGKTSGYILRDETEVERLYI